MAVRKDSPRAQDSDTKAMLYEGASLSQLGHLFGMDRRTVSQKLGVAVKPCGKREGNDIYNIADAARVLVEHDLPLESVEDISRYVSQLDPTRLPRLLTKEFWAAMLNKARYEEQMGDLMRTSDVVEIYGDLVKAIRTPLVLAVDTIDAQAELSETQREVAMRLIDSLLIQLGESTEKMLLARKIRRTTPAVEDNDDL